MRRFINQGYTVFKFVEFISFVLIKIKWQMKRMLMELHTHQDQHTTGHWNHRVLGQMLRSMYT